MILLTRLLNFISLMWYRLGEVGVTVDMSSEEAKRVRFANKVLIPIFLPSIPFGFLLIHEQRQDLLFVHVFFMILLVLVPFFNARRYYQVARFVMILGGMVTILMMGLLSGFDSGEHLSFIVLMVLAFCLFDVRQYVSIAFSCFVVVIGFLWLDFADLPLQEVAESGLNKRLNYRVNFLIVLGCVVLAITYFKKLSHHQVEEIIDRAQRDLKALFDNSLDAIFVLRSDNESILACNQRAVELFEGADKEELQGILLANLARDTKFLLNPGGDGDSKDAAPEQALQCKTLKGRVFWGSIGYSEVFYAGQKRMLIRIADINERMLAEEALLASREREKKAHQAKDYFLSIMSHELRTPVVGIKGVADILESEENGDPEIISMLRESSDRLLHTVSNILEMTRLQSLKGNLTLEEENIDEIVLPSIEAHRTLAEEKGLTLKIVPASAAHFARVNKTFLLRVVENLLSNAIKFTHEGAIEVRIFTEQEKGGRALVVIEVKDTGIGMSHDFVMSRLFNVFEQENTGLNRTFEGAGLGLSVSKRVLEFMNGTIEVDSEQGIGTTIRVALPLVRVAALAQFAKS